MKFEDLEGGKLYTIPEVCELLNCTRQSIYNWIRSGRLEGVHVGARWKFTREQLADFLKLKTDETTSE